VDKRTKGCLWIGLGVAVVGAMVCVALVAGVGYWAYASFAPDARFVDQATADAQIEEIRARFKQQKPLIDIEDDETARLQTEGRPGGFTGQLRSLHIAAYDTHAGKLVRFSVPFWMLRMAPDGKVSVGDGMLDGVRGADQITVKQLEALGPGLLIDESKPDGGRVIVWTE
jgi:hypothetical protein